MKPKKKQSLTDFLTDQNEQVDSTHSSMHSAESEDVSKSEKERFEGGRCSEKAEKRRRKKEQKLARREEKRQKRRIRRHEDAVLYSPDQMESSKISILLGYFLRFFSIAFSIFGITVLLSDSFLTADLNYGILLLYSVLTVSAFSLIFIGRKLIFVGISLFVGTVGVLTLLFGSPITFYLGGLVKVINQAMKRLKEAGFASANPISESLFGTLSGVSEEMMLYGGLFLVITLLALVFSAFSAKRTRLFPMLLIGGGLCVVCFTYNLCRSNWGIACVLAGLCSAVVLSTYDKIYAAHKRSRKSRAYSGFASSLAGILAFAVLLLPAGSTENPWRSISVISEPMQTLRMIVTTILTGGNPKLNVMNTLTKEKSAKLEEVEFDEVSLFEVSSYLRGQNIYLRSWIASDYDLTEDSWGVLSEEDDRKMQNETRRLPSGYTGDLASSQLASLFDPWLDIDSIPKDGFSSMSEKGYYTSYVDIRYTGNTGQLYLLPSLFLQSAGLYAYGSRNIAYKESWERYSDGIYRSSWMNLKKKYAAIAMIPTYIDANFGEYADRVAALYTITANFLENVYPKDIDADQLTADYLKVLESAGLPTGNTLMLDHFIEAAQSNSGYTWKTYYIDYIKQYGDYVKKAYVNYPTDSSGISKIHDQIASDVSSAETAYDRIMAIVNYLILNYEYTTSPTTPSEQYASDLDAFLLETKNGYCVQFATAATLLLRSFGIPARYVQGYIATDAYESEDEEGNPNYTSVVRDSNAHAWVEVWMDGLGWRTFEVTPSYYENLYYVDSGSDDAENPLLPIIKPTTSETISSSEPETEAPETRPQMPGDSDANNSSDQDESDDHRKVIWIGIGCMVAAALCALILWLALRRAQKIAAGRRYFIERAIYGTFEDSEEMYRVALTLGDGIYVMMSALGYRPLQGETPMEFAVRVDHPPKPTADAENLAIARQLLWAHTFTSVSEVLEKCEFSGTISREELALMGEFWESIVQIEYRALPWYRKIWVRYLRCIL